MVKPHRMSSHCFTPWARLKTHTTVISPVAPQKISRACRLNQCRGSEIMKESTSGEMTTNSACRHAEEDSAMWLSREALDEEEVE